MPIERSMVRHEHQPVQRQLLRRHRRGDVIASNVHGINMAHRMPTQDHKETRQVLALIAAGVVATIVLVTMPVFVAGIVDSFGWGDSEIGWLASADMAGGAIACIFLMPAIAKLRWRPAAAIAIVVVVAGNLASIAADSFATLMLIRLTIGLANGVILAIVFTGLCHSSNPERYFGIYVFTQLSLQVALLAIFPGALAAAGIAGMFLLVACASAASSLLLPLFPTGIARHRHAVAGDASTTASPPIRYAANLPGGWALVALSAQALYFLAPAAIWGYLEPIGGTFALDISDVGYTLSLASIAGIGGAAVVVLLGARYERIVCMATGVVISVVAALLWLFGSGIGVYLLAAALFSFAWNYTFPYQMGVLAQFDDSGNVAVLSLMVQLVGLAFGPAIASFLVIGGDYGPILWASVGCYILSFFMFASANRRPPVIEGAVVAN